MALPICLVSKEYFEEDLKYCAELPSPNNLPRELAKVIIEYLRSLNTTSMRTFLQNQEISKVAVNDQGKSKEFNSSLESPKDVKDFKGLNKSKYQLEINDGIINRNIATISNELQTIQEVKSEVDVRSLPLPDKIKYITENMWDLIPKRLGISQSEFKEARIENKAAMIMKLLNEFFEFVRVRPENPQFESVTYVADDNILWDPMKEVLEPVVGVLISLGLARRTLLNELEVAITSTGNIIPHYMVDPWDYLKLREYVLDLNELRLLSTTNYYFRYNKLDVRITQQELDEIKSGSYDIEKNIVYKLWHNRFNDQNFEFFIDSVGTWLAPIRFKHIGYLIGPTNVGKSSLLAALTNPIGSIVARVSPRSLASDYPFSLTGLIGKQINVYSEKIIPTMKNITALNNIAGEEDFIEVHRKHREAIVIRSLKSMMFAMAGLPIILEYSGEDLKAFAERLSIIMCKYPEEGFEIRRGVVSEVPKEEAFKFLLWCRHQLEERKWEIRRLSTDEILERLLKSSNTAIRFIEESGYVEKDPTGSAKALELYEVYKKWCMENKLIPMSRDDFYSTLGSMFMDYKREGSKWFKGIRIKYSAFDQKLY